MKYAWILKLWLFFNLRNLKKAANLLRNDYFFVYQPINIKVEGKL